MIHSTHPLSHGDHTWSRQAGKIHIAKSQACSAKVQHQADCEVEERMSQYDWWINLARSRVIRIPRLFRSLLHRRPQPRIVLGRLMPWIQAISMDGHHSY